MAYPINDNPELIALVKETLCPSDINVLLTDKTGVFLLATLPGGRRSPTIHSLLFVYMVYF